MLAIPPLTRASMLQPEMTGTRSRPAKLRRSRRQWGVFVKSRYRTGRAETHIFLDSLTETSIISP